MVIDFINLNGGGGGSGYTLPIASSSVLGGVKVGSGLTINPQSGVLSAEGGQGGGIEVVSQLPSSGTDGQMVMLVETANGEERQTLFVYGTSSKPAIEYSKSRDGHFLDINWFDVKRVLADGDTMFDVRYFGNISYSAGTIYSKTDSGLNITPSSTVEERNDVYIQLDGDTLKFCMDRNKTISAFTLGNKAEMSGWTRVGITQEDYADGVANNDNYGKVKVKNRVDGLYIGNDGYLKSDVTVATATTGTTGVVKPSSGLNIDNQGTLTTQVQTENVGNHIVKIWLGTQAEFDQISTPDQYTVYIIKQTTTQSN